MRSSDKLSLGIEIVHHVLYGFKMGEFLIGDDDAVIILNLHQQLQDIERICTQILLDSDSG